jgi:hypothetical protein
MGAINGVLTGATPQFWNGVDLQFEIALFYGSTLLAVSNLDSITVDVKAIHARVCRSCRKRWPAVRSIKR